MDILHLRKGTGLVILRRRIIKISAFTLIQSLTLDKLGFWEYLARFSLDKLINGPSGLVNMEAWRKRKQSSINKHGL